MDELMRNANYYIFKQKSKDNGQKSTFLGHTELSDLSRLLCTNRAFMTVSLPTFSQTYSVPEG